MNSECLCSVGLTLYLGFDELVASLCRCFYGTRSRCDGAFFPFTAR